MLNFREICFDLFHLLDQDNDNYLRKLTLKSNNSWYEGDIDDDFWDIFKNCVPLTIDEVSPDILIDPDVTEEKWKGTVKLGKFWIDTI